MTDSTRSAGRGPSGGQLVPDFDRLPVADLRNRIRSLTREQLLQLLAHEEQHGNRAPVLELIRGRIGRLDAGAEPSAGSSRAPAAPPPEGGSAMSPGTAGPPVDPPRGLSGRSRR